MYAAYLDHDTPDGMFPKDNTWRGETVCLSHAKWANQICFHYQWCQLVKVRGF